MSRIVKSKKPKNNDLEKINYMSNDNNTNDLLEGEVKNKVSKKRSKGFWIKTIAYLLVPIIASTISTIHVVRFFSIPTPENYYWLAIYTAVAFEVGALASLASVNSMTKLKSIKFSVWFIFVTLTAYQCMGNSFYAYDVISTKMQQTPDLLNNWAELLWMSDFLEDNLIAIKRAFSWVAGGFLPVLSLFFLHILTEHLKQDEEGLEEKKHKDKESDYSNNEGIISETEKDIEEIEPDKKEDEISFPKFLEKKRKEVEESRGVFLPMLELLFNKGDIKKGDELPSYFNFENLVKEQLPESLGSTKTFLILCNYLNITELSNKKRIALKSYEKSKEILDEYLTFNNDEN